MALQYTFKSVMRIKRSLPKRPQLAREVYLRMKRLGIYKAYRGAKKTSSKSNNNQSIPVRVSNRLCSPFSNMPVFPQRHKNCISIMTPADPLHTAAEMSPVLPPDTAAEIERN